MFRWETSDVTIVRSAWRHSAECVRGLCGVRARVVRSAWGHGAEPMRRACGAFRWECAGRVGRHKKRDKRDRRDREFCGVGG